jgi:hypothetical protein
MSNDADPETVPRGDVVFNRALAALGDEMQSRGFRVVDETAATLKFGDPTVRRRTDAQLIERAREFSEPRLDGIVIFQLYSGLRPAMGLRVPAVRIQGRVLHVWGSEHLAADEAGDSDLPGLPPSCQRDCEQRQIGGHAQRFARELGGRLADKLSALLRRREQAAPR